MSIPTILYIIVQCTWGLPQTLIGFAEFLLHFKDKHYLYHGAVITEWANPASVSLGLFVFVTTAPLNDKSGKVPREQMPRRLLVHEYGHTIQSLMFGPLYLIIMGIPSFLWANMPSSKWRREKTVSYFSFFTERFANALGEWVTGEASPGQAVI